MLALKIICAILLVLALIAWIRVGCRVYYNADGLTLDLRVAFLHIRLLPGQRKKKPAKPKKEKKKKSAEAPAEGAGADQKKQSKGSLTWLLQLVGPVLRALGKLRRKLCIERLQVDYAIGGAEDPAGAAVKYGIVSAGGGALLPLIRSAFDVRKWEMQLDVDFQSEQSQVALEAEASYRIGQIIAIVVPLGVKALGAYLKQQKQKDASQTTKDKEEHKHGRKTSDR
jgi:hypothetical protein